MTKGRNSTFKLYAAHCHLNKKTIWWYYNVEMSFAAPIPPQGYGQKKLSRPVPISFKLFPHPFPKLHPGDFSHFFFVFI